MSKLIPIKPKKLIKILQNLRSFMKTSDKFFYIILAIEAIITAIIYFFFSKWDGGYCNQPSILNPFGENPKGPCILMAIHLDRGGVPFYVSLDIFLLTTIIFVIYKAIRVYKKYFSISGR